MARAGARDKLAYWGNARLIFDPVAWKSDPEFYRVLGASLAPMKTGQATFLVLTWKVRLFLLLTVLSPSVPLPSP